MDMDVPAAPPMDQDPMMGGGDPMAGGPDPMAGGDPNAADPMAGGEDPMAGPEPTGEDDELTNIINGLSIEDKAAVLKYAKSMASESEGAQQPQMPTESRMVRTTMREMLNSTSLPPEDRKTERKERKLPKKVSKSSPFVSPY